jgi:hypothetical protein
VPKVGDTADGLCMVAVLSVIEKMTPSSAIQISSMMLHRISNCFFCLVLKRMLSIRVMPIFFN